MLQQYCQQTNMKYFKHQPIWAKTDHQIINVCTLVFKNIRQLELLQVNSKRDWYLQQCVQNVEVIILNSPVQSGLQWHITFICLCSMTQQELNRVQLTLPAGTVQWHQVLLVLWMYTGTLILPHKQLEVNKNHSLTVLIGTRWRYQQQVNLQTCYHDKWANLPRVKSSYQWVKSHTCCQICWRQPAKPFTTMSTECFW